MKYIDTQIISYVYSGKRNIDIKDHNASSVAISEFLQLYIPDNFTSANFYPRLAANFYQEYIHLPNVFLDKKHNKRAKHRTDQILFNFNGNYPAFIEYGSLALHYAFRNKNKNILLASMSHYDKSELKEMSEKIKFLFANNITCIPLSETTIDIMLNTLSSVEKEYNLKDNFRNSINDLLIASTAYSNNEKLITEDKLLNKIIAKHLNMTIEKVEDDVIELKTEKEQKRKVFMNSESKGYINRGWQHRINNRI